MPRWVMLGCAMALLACGDATSSSGGEGGVGPGGSTPGACPPGEQASATGCCPAGTTPLEDGSCQPAGVVACPEGFTLDEGLCVVMLPESCPDGQMALPGDAVCAPVAPCGAPPWGGIELGDSPQHVDATYAGGDSDGSADKPWTTLGEAYAAAVSGAVIAVAPGDYDEDLHITNKPVELVGLCPEEVRVMGAGGVAAVLVTLNAAGTRVAGLSISGPNVGLGLTGSADLRAENLWVHDTGDYGVVIQDDGGPTNVQVSRVLVERGAEVGLFTWGALVEADGVVLRDTTPVLGRAAGLVAASNPASSSRGDVRVRRGVFDRVDTVGVFVAGADVELEESVVQHFGPGTAEHPAVGVRTQDDPDTGQPSTVAMTRSVVRRGERIGLLGAGGAVTLDGVSISDITAASTGFGRGVQIQDGEITGARCALSVMESTLARLVEVGFTISGADYQLDGVLVRDVAPDATGALGRGLNIQRAFSTGEPSLGRVDHSRVERVAELGVLVSGSEADLLGTAIADVALQALDQRLGRGLHVQPFEAPARLAFVDGSIDRVVETGLNVTSSLAEVRHSAIRDVAARPQQLFGDGVIALNTTAGQVLVVDSLVANAERAGVVTFGGVLALGGTTLSCVPLPLAAEDQDGIGGVIEDLGGNHCLCDGAQTPCKVATQGLVPPEPL